MRLPLCPSHLLFLCWGYKPPSLWQKCKIRGDSGRARIQERGQHLQTVAGPRSRSPKTLRDFTARCKWLLRSSSARDLLKHIPWEAGAEPGPVPSPACEGTSGEPAARGHHLVNSRDGTDPARAETGRKPGGSPRGSAQGSAESRFVLSPSLQLFFNFLCEIPPEKSLRHAPSIAAEMLA